MKKILILPLVLSFSLFFLFPHKVSAYSYSNWFTPTHNFCAHPAPLTELTTVNGVTCNYSMTNQNPHITTALVDTGLPDNTVIAGIEVRIFASDPNSSSLTPVSAYLYDNGYLVNETFSGDTVNLTSTVSEYNFVHYFSSGVTIQNTMQNFAMGFTHTSQTIAFDKIDIRLIYGSGASPSPSPIPGCTNPDADNYDSSATVDDGSCIIGGCTDQGANNYDSDATYNDGSCSYGIDPENLSDTGWLDFEYQNLPLAESLYNMSLVDGSNYFPLTANSETMTFLDTAVTEVPAGSKIVKVDIGLKLNSPIYPSNQNRYVSSSFSGSFIGSAIDEYNNQDYPVPSTCKQPSDRWTGHQDLTGDFDFQSTDLQTRSIITYNNVNFEPYGYPGSYCPFSFTIEGLGWGQARGSIDLLQYKFYYEPSGIVASSANDTDITAYSWDDENSKLSFDYEVTNSDLPAGTSWCATRFWDSTNLSDPTQPWGGSLLAVAIYGTDITNQTLINNFPTFPDSNNYFVGTGSLSSYTGTISFSWEPLQPINLSSSTECFDSNNSSTIDFNGNIVDGTMPSQSVLVGDTCDSQSDFYERFLCSAFSRLKIMAYNLFVPNLSNIQSNVASLSNQIMLKPPFSYFFVVQNNASFSEDPE